MWLVRIDFSVACLEFDGRDAQLAAEIKRGWVKRPFRDSCPEVELIATASTVKAAEEIAREVNREATRTEGPAAQRTRATPLWTAAKGGLPVRSRTGHPMIDRMVDDAIIERFLAWWQTFIVRLSFLTGRELKLAS